MSIEIPGFLKKTEEVIYEFMVFFILYPIAFYKTIINFKRLVFCVNYRSEFVNSYFPPVSYFLFTCFLTVLLSPQKSKDIVGFMSSDKVSYFLQNNETLILFFVRVTVFLPFPFVVSIFYDLTTPGKITRDSFREPFELACLISSPFIMLSSLSSSFMLMDAVKDLFVVLFALIQLWFLISLYYMFRISLKKIKSILLSMISYILGWLVCISAVFFFLK